MSSSSSKDRVWDYRTQQWVRYSGSQRRWVDDRHGRPLRDAPQLQPSTTPAVAPSTSQPKPVPQGSGQRSVDDVTKNIKQLTVGSPPAQKGAAYTTTPEQRASAQSAQQQGPSSVRATTQNPVVPDSRTGTQGVKPTPYTVSTSQYMRTTADKDNVTSQGASQSTITRLTTPYNATFTDQKTGFQTHWTVSGNTQYKESEHADSGRILNVKRIRQGGNRPSGEERPLVTPARNTPEQDFRNGRVIEVLLVPTEDVDFVSSITPADDDTVDKHGGIGRRRFVIIRQLGDRRFEALAIKTYYGRGVSAPGVIKSHHSVIYTGRPEPLLPEESPRRLRDNRMENPMQSVPIRVISGNRGRALDPMSRLDYADRYEFDYDVSNIRMFGLVHGDSLAALFLQYNSVWQSIKTAVQGASYGPASSYAASSTTATGLSMPPALNTNVSSTTATAGSSRTGSTAQSSATIQQSRSTRSASTPSPAVLLRQYGQRNSGRCTVEQMSAIIQYLREYASRNRLQPPVVTATQMQELARNTDQRVAYLQQIRSAWRAVQGQDDNAESDEEDDEDESDDD